MRAVRLAIVLGAAVCPAAAQSLVYTTYQLDNGLRVILSEDHSAAIVTINVWYDVGSRNERPGRSGFAHLFEHMMFQGSEHVKKGEHLQLIERAGGMMNGSTNEDRTIYYETLPSNRLNLGLWLEADRMRSLAITPENFENQRETVKEERRMGVDNRPYGAAFNDGPTLLFDSTTCFPYAHTVIGSMADLDAAEVTDVQQFFDRYYAPNHATVAVVGDIDPSATRQLIAQYFGDIPRGGETPPVRCAVQYAPGPGRQVFADPLATLPAVLLLYRIPRHADAVTRPLELLRTLLGDGESSRLHRALVREAQSALQVGAFTESRLGPGIFLLYAVANEGVSADTLAAQMAAEVARVVAANVSDSELARARNDYRAAQIFARETTLDIARELQHYAHYHADMADITRDLDRYMAVTAEEIRAAAAQYLVPANCFTIIANPAPAADSEQ